MDAPEIPVVEPNIPLPVIPFTRETEIAPAMPIPDPVVDAPDAELPWYTPIPIPLDMNDLEPILPQEEDNDDKGQKKEKKTEKKDEKKPTPEVKVDVPYYENEATYVTIPGLGYEMPLPKPEIVSAAFVTSAVSVGAALGATSLFKQVMTIMKPVLKQGVNRLLKLRGKKPPTWARERVAQRRNRSVHKENQRGS